MNDFTGRAFDFLERVAADPVYYAIRVILIFVLLVVLLMAAGCAPDAATLTQWEAEYDARPAEKTEVERLKERVAAIEARAR